MSRAPVRTVAAVCVLAALPPAADARSLRKEELRAALESLVRNFDGRAGICTRDGSGQALLVGLAAMEAVDRGAWRLDEPVLVRRQDLSLFVQLLAKLVTVEGFRTTLGDLVRRAMVDSDSAATDILVAKLGGPRRVQEFLDRHKIPADRFDRDERHLQTEIAGLEWRAEFVDPAVFESGHRCSSRKPPRRLVPELPARPARHRHASRTRLASPFGPSGRRPLPLVSHPPESASASVLLPATEWRAPAEPESWFQRFS